MHYRYDTARRSALSSKLKKHRRHPPHRDQWLPTHATKTLVSRCGQQPISLVKKCLPKGARGMTQLETVSTVAVPPSSNSAATSCHSRRTSGAVAVLPKLSDPPHRDGKSPQAVMPRSRSRQTWRAWRTKSRDCIGCCDVSSAWSLTAPDRRSELVFYRWI